MCHPGMHPKKNLSLWTLSGVILTRCGGRFSCQMGCSFRVREFFTFITVTAKANAESGVVSGFSSLQFLDFRKLRGRVSNEIVRSGSFEQLGGVWRSFSFWLNVFFWFRGEEMKMPEMLMISSFFATFPQNLGWWVVLLLRYNKK